MSWSSKKGTSGYDQQICPGIFLYSLPFVKNLFKNYRSRTSEKWKAKEDKIEEVKKKKTKKGDGGWNDAEWQPSSWSWQQPMTLGLVFILHPGNSGAQTKRVSVLIGKHQPIGTAQIKRVSGIPGSRRSNGSEEQKDLIHENIYKGIHDDGGNV